MYRTDSEYIDYIEDKADEAMRDLDYIRAVMDKDPIKLAAYLSEAVSYGELEILTQYVKETLEAMIDEECKENREMANAGCMY